MTRILITNNTLAGRGGSELYVRDLASRLQMRGHQVVAYSSMLGAIADDLRDLGVPVISDLKSLTEPPDVIHGHHYLDALAAALHFPNVPIVHAVHGWLPWQEMPLKLPSTRRFVAVSALTREHLVTSGIDPSRVSIIANFVDMRRFGKLRQREAPIKRVLVYGNSWTADAPALHLIREACQRRGMDFQAVGSGLGNEISRPEDFLPSVDLVFALGRCALEALACGCAVIVADRQGIDGVVSTDSFPHQRSANFGLALIAGKPVTAAAIDAALDKLDIENSARVSDIVREEADIDIATDQWESLYRLAIAEGAAPLAETIAAASQACLKLKDLLWRLETSHSVMNSRYGDLSTMKQTLDDEVAEKTQQLAETARQLAEKTRQLDAASSQLKAITHTLSWRVTAPLRAVRRYLR